METVAHYPEKLSQATHRPESELMAVAFQTGLILEPSAQRCDRLLGDASEQAAAQQWIPLEIIQLSAGSYAGRYRELELGDFGLVVESQNCAVHKRGVMHNNLCTLSFPRSRGSNLRFSTHLSQDQSLFLLPCATEFDIQVEGGDETLYFRLPFARLEADLRQLDPGFFEIGGQGVQCFTVGDKRPLNALVDYLLAQPNRALDRHLTRTLREQLLYLMARAQGRGKEPPTGLTALRRAAGVVERSMAYAEAEFAARRLPSIVDICREAGGSQRTLEYSFRTLLGLTPIAYLRTLRLNRVRAQLLSPSRADLTVTEVATEWCFWHLGKFSRDYAAMFGESPSQTLRRSHS